MTTAEIAAYYANLLLAQYITKPRAYATITTNVTPIIMDQLPLAVQNAFNMDGSAGGQQLDVLGKYAGVSRNGFLLNNTPITLSDAQYFNLIQIVIVQNYSNSSLQNIQQLLFNAFGLNVTVKDYKDMTMAYTLNSAALSDDLIEVFIKDGRLPRPMGVGLRSTVISPTAGYYFGYNTYAGLNTGISGFNTYSSYSMTSPWLNYGDLLT